MFVTALRRSVYFVDAFCFLGFGLLVCFALLGFGFALVLVLWFCDDCLLIRWFGYLALLWCEFGIDVVVFGGLVF